jgi:cytochrome c5
VAFPASRAVGVLILGFGTIVAAPSALANDGKAVYDRACVACHGTGVANAPRLGDKAAWGHAWVPAATPWWPPWSRARARCRRVPGWLR